MRINKFIAQSTGLSRRAADRAIRAGQVSINGRAATLGDHAGEDDEVKLDGQLITPAVNTTTVLLNKPAGYVCSRNGQGSRTVYDLMPAELHRLKTVGRLDKASSGLLLLTDDGQLANRLTHPSQVKQKVYEVRLDRPLTAGDLAKVRAGVQLEDGPSRLEVTPADGKDYEIRMHEGRNRQIRRTFDAIGYEVVRLHRTRFGDYALDGLPSGELRRLP